MICANGAAPSEQQILSCFLFCQVFCYIRIHNVLQNRKQILLIIICFYLQSKSVVRLTLWTHLHIIKRQAKRISINLYIQTGMKLLKAYSQLVLVVFVGEKRGISRVCFFFRVYQPRKVPKIKTKRGKVWLSKFIRATPWGFVIDRDRSTSCWWQPLSYCEPLSEQGLI